MAENILSFDDYAVHMAKKVRLLRHFERCIFSAWCAEHLLGSCAPLVEESLSKADVRILRRVLDVIWGGLLDGSIPKTDVLNELDMQFMQIELLPADLIATWVQNAVGLCILGCRRNVVDLAQAVAEIVVKVLDFELAEQDPDYADHSLSEMFRHPTMRNELEAQLAMIRHLRGEYRLDASLRSMFRR